MLGFLARRAVLMVATLIVVSMIAFIIIELPPGSFLDAYVSQLMSDGRAIDESEIASLRSFYGLDDPAYVRYFRWVGGIVLRGDLGRSLEWRQPVRNLIADRLPFSFAISLASLVVVFAIGVPIGVLCATKQYSISDYFFTFVGFIGLAVPNFLLALIFLWLYFDATGRAAVGLFSAQYAVAPWSFGKFLDLLRHLWVPALITGTAGTAGLIRVMRANLLDELQRPYVMVARAKGLTERKLLYKYPFRIAMNPVISTIGWTLPNLVSGELLVSLVLGLPTIAPLLVTALLHQDMYLAGSIVMILSALTIIGTFVSDLLLAWVDPRIRGVY
ncbi:MAG: ABC transporter permease [Spirochaetaceae bacterium]|nr:MAG: ABC transporter permease [Spirochaetaceae bacterium]